MGTSRLLMSGAATVVALGMAAGAGADPRDGYRGRAVPRGDRHGTYEIAFEKGYGEGLKDGRKDHDRRRRFDPARHDEYREGDHGYRDRYGSRYRYVQGFRTGYERGYRDGYDVRGSLRGRAARSRYESRTFDAYDFQRDGRHRHRERSGWCRVDHDHDRGRYVREIPRY